MPVLPANVEHVAVLNSQIYCVNTAIAGQVELTGFVHFDCPFHLCLVTCALFGPHSKFVPVKAFTVEMFVDDVG
jgi:hypothetical protein